MLIYNIGALISAEGGKPFLRGEQLNNVSVIENAWLLTDNGRIAAYGATPCPEAIMNNADETYDAKGGIIVPSMCDSHTHIVYPESRAGEFLDKINGLSYEEIARRGGGILNSADRVAGMSEARLLQVSLARVAEVMAMGTGAIEIKSGYGLSLESELKMLRVIDRKSVV